MTFTYLDLDVVDWTHLEVFDGEGLDGPSRGHWEAGTDTVPLPITSNGNALTVHVTSGYELLARFSFTYSVLDSGKWCDRFFFYRFWYHLGKLFDTENDLLRDTLNI